MVMQRHDAEDAGAADVVRRARAVYLVGDSSQHLRSALKGTAVFAALGDVLDGGGVVAAVGASAAALCDPMLDQRGGAFTLGLGLRPGLAVIPEAGRGERGASAADAVAGRHARRRAADRLGARAPADGWELVGEPTVHGELPSDDQPVVVAASVGAALGDRRRSRRVIPRRGVPSAVAEGVIAWATSSPR